MQTRADRTVARALLTAGLRRFRLLSLLMVSIPLPFALALLYLGGGFRPGEVLTLATRNNAACLGHAESLGRIEAGYRADLVLVADNPLKSLDTLRRPRWVMLDGQIVVRAP